MGIAERVADPDDPLRALIRGSLRAHIPPTIFMRIRTSETPWWTDADTAYIMALEDYEAGLCPGCNHPLAETTRPEHADAYRPGEQIRCHYCKAQSLIAEVAEKAEDSAGVLVPIVLDPDVVALTLLPVPPLPPELGGT